MRRVTNLSAPVVSTNQVHLGELVQVQVRVLASGREHPEAILWKGRTYRVKTVIATWRVDGRWWSDARRIGVRRRYYRLDIACHTHRLLVEIYQQDCHWYLWRILD